MTFFVKVRLNKMAGNVVKFYTAKYRDRIARTEAEEAKQRLQQEVQEEVTEDQSATASGRMEAFKVWPLILSTMKIFMDYILICLHYVNNESCYLSYLWILTSESVCVSGGQSR